MKPNFVNLIVGVLVHLFIAVFASPLVYAQAVSAKPIKLIIGFVPGGGIDITARIIAPGLAEALGQPVIVENKPGANGVIATDMVAKSIPDGTTLLMGTFGNLSLNPIFNPNLPFNIERDLAPVTLVASVPFLVLTNPTLPVTSFNELLAYAKANPGKVNYSSSGNGGLPHLAGEMINGLGQVSMTHVPYKGSAPMIADLLSGQVQVTFDAVSTSMQWISSGKLRALAVTGRDRLKDLPNVPSVSEILPGFEMFNWYGIVVPSGTPRSIINRLNAAFVKVLNGAEVRERLLSMGTQPVGGGPEELGAFMKSETVKWARTIKTANIKID